MGVSGQHHAPAALYPQGKDPLWVPTGQEAGWNPEPVWTQRLEEESFHVCQGSNLDRMVIQYVVRLSYPGSHTLKSIVDFSE
jgi:hypothetical protein